ncbi:MAG: dihydroorotate dehydrogenase-like protein [Nitriliruptoraceae bacterium]
MTSDPHASIGDADSAPPGPGRVVLSGPRSAAGVDLTVNYLGMSLVSPLIASASPLTGDIQALRQLAAGRVGAVVLPSLFEEQITRDADQMLAASSRGAGAHAEAPSGYLPAALDRYNTGAVRYLRLVRDARQAVTIPVIASLNGVSPGGWVRYAKLLADEGADAIELNVYRVAADPEVSGRAVEDATLALVSSVAASAGVPIAVKVSPFYSAFAHFAHRLVDAGASGLVVFNRFYQPDIDLDTLTVTPQLALSTSEDLRLPLRWCALLFGTIDASLAATSGVHTVDDVVKLILAGADAVMTTSALLRHGPGHASVLVDGLESWLDAHGYARVADARGAVSQRRADDPAAFERANYLATILAYSARSGHGVRMASGPTGAPPTA